MDPKQTGLGIVLFIVFWVFQAGYLNGLGTTSWLIGAIVFSVILFLIGKSVMPKSNEKQRMLWNFTIGVALLVTLFVAYVAPYVPGIVIPSGDILTIVTPILLSLWLVLFGGAMFITGWEMKWNITLLIGVIWLFSAITWVLNAGPNAYLHFAIVTSFPYIIAGLLAKD